MITLDENGLVQIEEWAKKAKSLPWEDMEWDGCTLDQITSCETALDAVPALVAEVRKLRTELSKWDVLKSCGRCGTKDVSIEQTCHNSSCEMYAHEQTMFELWKQRSE